MEENSQNEYTSCNIIEHGFDAQINSINLCCRISKDENNERVALIKNYQGEKIDWNNFFALKDKLINLQKQGKTIPYCRGCLYLENKNWENEHYINTININNWIKCNADCIYCDRRQYKHIKEYNIYPLIKDLVKNKLLKMPADITIAGGEPTITRDFDKTLDIFIKNKISPVRVLTNGIKYNKYIEKGLKSGLVNILVSVDSGSKEFYERIKRTNKFDEVWKNLKKYAKNQKEPSLVKTKYIIIPGVNDRESEILSFMKYNLQNGIKYTEIDLEISWYCRYCNNLELLKRMYNLYLQAKQEGEKSGIITNAFDRMKLAESKL